MWVYMHDGLAVHTNKYVMYIENLGVKCGQSYINQSSTTCTLLILCIMQ